MDGPDHSTQTKQGHELTLNTGDKQKYGAVLGQMHGGGGKNCIQWFYLKKSKLNTHLKVCAEAALSGTKTCVDTNVQGNSAIWEMNSLEVNSDELFHKEDKWLVSSMLQIKKITIVHTLASGLHNWIQQGV